MIAKNLMNIQENKLLRNVGQSWIGLLNFQWSLIKLYMELNSTKYLLFIIYSKMQQQSKKYNLKIVCLVSILVNVSFSSIILQITPLKPQTNTISATKFNLLGQPVSKRLHRNHGVGQICTNLNMKNIFETADRDLKVCRHQRQCSSSQMCFGFVCLDKCVISGCLKTEKCVNGQCIKQSCQVHSDCQSFQICQNQKCINKCEVADCRYGCEDGKCLKQKCAVSQQCSLSQACVDQQCRQECQNIKCGPFQQCLHGKCQRKTCHQNDQCLKSEACTKGKCVQACQKQKCQFGYQCLHGKCTKISRKCQNSGECGMGQKCQKGICVDRCQQVKCSQKQVCVLGECKNINCGDKICPENSHCENNNCVPNMFICGQKSYQKARLCNSNRTLYENCKKSASSDQPSSYFANNAYCAFDGQSWSNVPLSECEICSSNQFIYFIERPCDYKYPVCDLQQVLTTSEIISDCKGQQICIDGSCSTKNCKVTKSYVQCQQKVDFTITMCQQPFSTQKCIQGPNLAPPGPPPNRCGITKTGQRINIMPWICSPCQRMNITFYFDQPCYDAPFICKSNDICNGEYCQTLGCASDEECPYDWQICKAGKCVDSCQMKKCTSCKFGKCQYKSNPLGRCYWNNTPFDLKCEVNENLACYSLNCIDDCTRQQCDAGQKCEKHNSCIPI